MTEAAMSALPRARNYFVECNERTPESGAFNGECMVFYNRETKTGDKFYLIQKPIEMPRAEFSADGARVVRRWSELVEPALPSWVNLIGEYEMPSGPKPLAQVPSLSHTIPNGGVHPDSALREPVADVKKRLGRPPKYRTNPETGESTEIDAVGE